MRELRSSDLKCPSRRGRCKEAVKRLGESCTYNSIGSAGRIDYHYGEQRQLAPR